MTNFPKLDHPPIREAIVSLRMTPICEDNLEDLEQTIPDKIRTLFPTKHERRQLEANLGPEVGTVSTKLDALLLKDRDERRTVAAGRLTFALSALAGSYDSFDNFIAEFKELWSAITMSRHPDRVLQLSTRFINDIQFSGNRIDLGEYFEAVPDLPDELPQSVESFRYEYVVPVDEYLRLRIILGSGKGSEDSSHVTLDIDAVKQVDFEYDDDKIWAAFSELRNLKNRAFFGILTDKAVQLFKD